MARSELILAVGADADWRPILKEAKSGEDCAHCVGSAAPREATVKQCCLVPRLQRTAAILLLATARLFAQEGAIGAALRLAVEGRLTEAESALRIVAGEYPKDADARYRLGLVLLKAKKVPEAVLELERATALDQAHVFAWLALADAHLRQQSTAPATQAATRAQSLAADSLPAWKALAVLQGRLGQIDNQVQALQKVIQLAPQEREPYVRLAALLLDKRKATAARAVSEAGLQLRSEDPELLRLRGLALYGLGLKPEAIDSFIKAMDAAPEDELVHSSVESLLADAGSRLPELRSQMARFRQRRPASPLGPYLLALASTSDEEKSVLFRESIALDASFWPAWFESHKLLRAHDRPGEAIEALETALRINPNHEGAHFALAELYLEAGNREKALQHRLEHNRLRSTGAH